MSRRRAAEKRTILPDHKYKDLVLAKFMNRIMLDGKKSTSEKIVYGAFDFVSKKRFLFFIQFLKRNGENMFSSQFFLPARKNMFRKSWWGPGGSY